MTKNNKCIVIYLLDKLLIRMQIRKNIRINIHSFNSIVINTY